MDSITIVSSREVKASGHFVTSSTAKVYLSLISFADSNPVGELHCVSKVTTGDP